MLFIPILYHLEEVGAKLWPTIKGVFSYSENMMFRKRDDLTSKIKLYFPIT